MPKGITFDLVGLRNTINELKQSKKLEEGILERIAQEAVDICIGYTPAMYGFLQDSTIKTNVSENHWTVTQTEPYAQYVEFGTGYVGKNEPHDALSTYAPQWEYASGDVISNTDELAWFYRDPRTDKLHYTMGQVASMQMYKTFLDLKAKYGDEIDIQLNVRGDYFG